MYSRIPAGMAAMARAQKKSNPLCLLLTRNFHTCDMWKPFEYARRFLRKFCAPAHRNFFLDAVVQSCVLASTGWFTRLCDVHIDEDDYSRRDPMANFKFAPDMNGCLYAQKQMYVFIREHLFDFPCKRMMLAMDSPNIWVDHIHWWIWCLWFNTRILHVFTAAGVNMAASKNINLPPHKEIQK